MSFMDVFSATLQIVGGMLAGVAVLAGAVYVVAIIVAVIVTLVTDR